MKNKTKLLVLFFLLISLFPLSTQAQEEALEEDLSPTPIEEQEETSQTEEEIKEIREAVKKKVQEKIQQITSSTTLNQKRAWYGIIEKVEEGKIQTKFQEKERTILLDSATTIIDLKRQEITSSDLKEGQQILSMGVVEQENTLEGKRLVLTSTPTDWSKTKVIYATISDISTESKVLVLTPLKNKNEQYEVKLDAKTNSDTDFSDFENGQILIAILTQSENGKLTYAARRLKTIKAAPTPIPEQETESENTQEETDQE